MANNNDLLTAALRYAEQGWPIFPARADKTPYPRNGVLDATTDPRQIEEWWRTWPDANIALDVGGAGMMVLDYDPGFNLEELEKNVGKIPASNLCSHTPRNGQHLFFALAEGEFVSPSSSKIAPHVDVRSFHSYVLLPPSQTKNGRYVWETTGKPAHRTDEMVRVANSAREKHEDRDTWIVEPDLPANVRTAKSWLLQDAKLATEGQGGEACAYATAAYLKSLAISEENALDLMLTHWNPRCDPPWGPDQEDHLRQKVSNAYCYNTSPPGNLTPGYHVAKTKRIFEVQHSPLAEGDETTVAGFRFVDRVGMDHIRPPTWIVKDFLADESYAILFGPYGAFKTFVALDLALSIAAGFPADPSWEVVSPGPVLFAAGEGRSDLLNRVRAWEALHYGGEKVEDFVLVDPVPTTIISEDALTAFSNEALRRHPNGYKATFIDTLGRAMEGADENSQRDASAMTALAYRLRTELGGSVLALHHSGLAEDKRPRGSSVFAADADTMVRASRRGKDHMVELTMAKQKSAPEWESERRLRLVKMQLSPGSSTLVAAPAPALTAKEKIQAKGDLREREDVMLGVIDEEVRAILEMNPLRTWTQRDLAEAVAMRERITLESKMLGNVYLIKVRERKGTYANSAYDPQRNRNTGRWRCPS